MSPAVVTLGVRYMTPVISVCIVARGFSSHPCSALAPGADTLYCHLLYNTAELPPNVKKKKSASFKYKLTKVPQPIKLVVRITLLVTFLKQLSEFYFLSN